MNLIICYTPLQVLIAEKIIEQHSEELFYAIMVDSVGNEKFRYYASRLASKATIFLTVNESFKSLRRLKDILSLKFRFHQFNFDKVFVASINDLYIQNIISTIRFNDFFTFDDGTSNIVQNGAFYALEKKNIKRRIINCLTGNKYDIQKLKALSQLHYTIFPNFPNIIKNCTAINLNTLTETNEVSINKDDSIHILLGQPVYLDQKKNIKLAKKAIEKFGIQKYFPHPREDYIVDGVSYIETPLIFEDYLMQNQDKFYRIYTYFSSSVFQILNFPNVEVISLRVETDNISYNTVYNMFDLLGIPILDI